MSLTLIYLLYIFFVCTIYYYVNDIIEILLDGIFYFKEDSLTKCLLRIYPLLDKYKRGRKLGCYEIHVLQRELENVSNNYKYCNFDYIWNSC